MLESCEENEVVHKFVPGDLLWTKVGKYPFWPCMITYDPADGTYTRLAKTRLKDQTIYHVQYFGEMVQHGWTYPGHSFSFQGEAAYFNRLAKALDRCNLLLGHKSKSHIKLLKAKYEIPIASQRRWKIAVQEAEEAMTCANSRERFETYVFNYDNVKKKHSLTNGTAHLNGNEDTLIENSDRSSKKIRLSEDPSRKVCDMCDKNDVHFCCSGICNKFFHMECLGMTCMPENFKCAECSSGVYSCFVCQKSDDTVIKCSHSKCSKHYHTDCMKQYECANKDKNICPLHCCLTCYRENPRNTMSRKGAMVKCIRCPTAFHSRETCIAAGSIELKGSAIICPYHFVGKQRVSPQKPCNMNYCSACSQGGELICCEACPNAFHENCLGTEIPTEDYLCEDCTNRKYLLYGMIVWGKIGNYRWWPAQIIHPSYLPENVKALPHYDGEFAVKYYGTYDYSWTHSGRVFPYVESHKKCPALKTNKYKEQYKKGLEEAAAAFDDYQKCRLTDSFLDRKPEAYKHIQVNRALPPAQIFTCDPKSVYQCSCDKTKERPCSVGSDCMNRSMLVECHPETCKAEELCENQDFVKRLQASTQIFKTKDCGWGLKTLQDIKSGCFVIEYVGEIITHEEYRRRSGEMQANGIANYYFLYMDSRRMIDAGPMGNYSRFINHSCTPNCEMKKWSVNGDARIGIFALEDIKAGEELTFDYQSDTHYEFNQKCYCSSPNCKGVIGKISAASKSTASIKNSSIFKSRGSKTSVSKVALNRNLNSKASGRKTPASKVSAKKIPVSEVSVRKIRVPEVSAKKIPVSEVSVRKIRVSEVSARKIPVSEVSARKMPTSKELISKTPISEVSVRKISTPKELISKTPLSEVSAKKIPTSKELISKTPLFEVSARKIPTSKELISKTPLSEVSARKISTSKELISKKPLSEVSVTKIPTPKELISKTPLSKASSRKSSDLVPVSEIPASIHSPPASTIIRKTPATSVARTKIPSSEVTPDDIPITCKVYNGPSVHSPSIVEAISRTDVKCFLCKDTGRLVACDKKGCVRAYHLKCLQLSDIPQVSEKEQPLSCTTHMLTNRYKSDTKFKRILQPAIQIWNVRRTKRNTKQKLKKIL